MDSDILKGFLNYLYQLVIIYKRSIRWILGVLVAAIVMLLYTYGAFDRLEYLTLDTRFLLRHPKPQTSDVVFIDMAEDSIEAIGRWPWPRIWHATLINALSEYNPKVIAFDIIFSEPQDKIDDTALAEAMSLAGNVYFPLLYDLNPSKIRYAYKGEGVKSILEPIENFMKRLNGTGHINAFPDSDGIMRRAPAVISYNGKATYQFGMQIAFDVMGVNYSDINIDPETHRMNLKLIRNKRKTIPLDKNNQLIINWKGQWGREFPHYSYIDVIRSYAAIKEGKRPIVDLNVFRDKICIIGLTATGLIDIKPIPIQSEYPAVGVNATIIHDVLAGDFIYDSPEWLNLLLIFMVIFVVTMYLCRLRILSGMILAIVSSCLYAASSILVFIYFKFVIVTFYPVFGILLSYSMTSAYTQVIQAAERARLFKQATRDGLTSLYNIRHFNLLYEAEFKNVSAYKSKRLALIMADLDSFKHLNDTYGHQAGDAILRDVARILESKCRQTDVVARYGGEEFIMMLSGAGAREAAIVAEKIRLAVEAKRYRFRNDTYSPTISLGVVEYSNEAGKDELIGKADAALYQSKKGGKNKVTIYSQASA